VRRMADWQFDLGTAVKLLTKQFGTRDLAGFDVAGMDAAIAAAGALWQYVQQTQRAYEQSAMPHVTGLTVERTDAYIRMDAATRRNLEITETIRGEATPTLFSILNTTATAMGARHLREWLHQPLRDHAAIRERHAATLAIAPIADAIHAIIGEWADIERIVTRIALRSARPRDLAALRAALATLPQLNTALDKCALFEPAIKKPSEAASPFEKEPVLSLPKEGLRGIAAGEVQSSFAREPDATAQSLPTSLFQREELNQEGQRISVSATNASPELSEIKTPLLAGVFSHFWLDNAVHACLSQSIADEPANMVRDGGVIRDGFDAELDELRALQSNASGFLLELEARERARTGIANLRVEYNRVHGFFIEVSQGQLDKVPDDYRRRQTLKNAERFITPELKVFEDKALSAGERALQREKFLYEEILTTLAPHIAALHALARATATLDVLCANHKNAIALKLIAPTFVTDDRLHITGGRHLVVESQVDSFIPNDCDLSRSRQLLLITGPNMGGKSTYMRQVAQIVLLAHTGLYVPATHVDIGTIDAIMTRIGASDDLAGGRSTFMVEMTEAAAILNTATKDSLVLVDEIGRGTSTFDGLSLAYAIARYLAETSRAYTLFATHYFELTRLNAELPNLANVHLDAIESKDKIVFLHKLEAGPANQSYGLQVAQLAGVPRSVVKAAKKQLGELEKTSLHNTSQTNQADLFAASSNRHAPEIETHPTLDRLRDAKPDEMSPREALDFLYQLQRELSSNA
jgi:DNA mismatch repair protein MutS